MNIRGSTPNQSNELGGSLVHAGLADPGPTCGVITPHCGKQGGVKTIKTQNCEIL
jgi:hypothetical protein